MRPALGAAKRCAGSRSALVFPLFHQWESSWLFLSRSEDDFLTHGLAQVIDTISMTLIPVLERPFIRDLIRRGEREGRKIEAVREKVQFRIEKKNHAR